MSTDLRVPSKMSIPYSPRHRTYPRSLSRVLATPIHLQISLAVLELLNSSSYLSSYPEAPKEPEFPDTLQLCQVKSGSLRIQGTQAYTEQSVENPDHKAQNALDNISTAQSMHKTPTHLSMAYAIMNAWALGYCKGIALPVSAPPLVSIMQSCA